MIFSDFYSDTIINDPVNQPFVDVDAYQYDIDKHLAITRLPDIKRHLRYNKGVIIDIVRQRFEQFDPIICRDCSQLITERTTIENDKFVTKRDFEYDHERVELLKRSFDCFNELDQQTKDLCTKWNVDILFKQFNVAVVINTYQDSMMYYLTNKDNFVYRRTVELEQNGIRVINIFEDHWVDNHKLTVLIDIITHALHQTTKRVYARDTVIVIDQAKNWKHFFEANNIQCYRNAKTAFVLIAKKDLPKIGISKGDPVMIYTVGHAHFGKGKYDAEIARGACLLGYSVVGGASKLWNTIIEYYKNHALDDSPGSVDSIVYYSDSNYYDGKSVRLLPGTEFVTMTGGFWNFWCKEYVMKNREPMRHKEVVARTHALKRLYEQTHKVPELNDVLQSEYAFEVWNAGTKTYVWTRQNM